MISEYIRWKINIKKLQEVIQSKIDELKKLKSLVGVSYEQINKAILNCKNGKVIVSGCWKSGIISKKWAATFSSTERLILYGCFKSSHGDMGQINSNDVQF